jgi:predicted transcriptional regulator
MNTKQLPFEKSDIHYDTTKGEVSLKREKFDELIRFVQDLLKEAEQTENERDTARSRQRRAAQTADVVTAYADFMEEANSGIQHWLENNTIQELSRRTGIPYASCYRIVRERLGSAQITVDTLGKILKVVGPSASNSPAVSLFVCGAKGAWKSLIEQYKAAGRVGVITASTGEDAAQKAQEHNPARVFVDVSTPELTAEIFSQLCNGSRVMVLTGSDKGKLHKLVEQAHAVDQNAEAGR